MTRPRISAEAVICTTVHIEVSYRLAAAPTANTIASESANADESDSVTTATPNASVLPARSAPLRWTSPASARAARVGKASTQRRERCLAARRFCRTSWYVQREQGGTGREEQRRDDEVR